MRINKHTSHPSAFISSTFLDLREERLAVAKALKESGINVNALDIQPASNDSSKAKIIEGIKESDFFILIIGDRYGSIIPEMTGSDIRSITAWEHQIAVRFRKNVLVYFKNGSDLPSDHPEDIDYIKKRHFFQKFKNELTSKHNPKYFDDKGELATEIKSALIPMYREGVIKLLSENSRLTEDLDRLKRQLEAKNNSERDPLKEAITRRQRNEYGLSDASTSTNGLGTEPLSGLAWITAGLKDREK